MFIEDDNNNELNISIDDLFKDPEPEVQPREETSEEPQPNMTKAVSERINTVRRKTEAETQDRIAKELGYDSYEAMQKANEQKMLRDAGLDEEEIGAVVEKLVQKRLAEDPRLKKLEEIEHYYLYQRINILQSELLNSKTFYYISYLLLLFFTNKDCIIFLTK